MSMEPIDSGSTDQTEQAQPASGQVSLDHQQFFMVRIIDGLMVAVKGLLSQGLVQQSSRWLLFIGLWALVAFAVLAVLFGLILAINVREFGPFGASLATAVLALALLYTAGKFCDAGRTIVDATASEMSSRSFLDCLALLSVVLTLVATVGGIVTGIRAGTMIPVGVGIGTGAGWAFLAAIALNPSLANVTVRSGATAGQECLGILSFFLKAVLRIVPIAFGVAVTVGTVLFAVGMIRYMAAESWDKTVIGMEMAEMGVYILAAAALPLAVYLVVLLKYLLIDLARAILRIA